MPMSEKKVTDGFSLGLSDCFLQHIEVVGEALAAVDEDAGGTSADEEGVGAAECHRGGVAAEEAPDTRRTLSDFWKDTRWRDNVSGSG